MNQKKKTITNAPINTKDLRAMMIYREIDIKKFSEIIGCSQNLASRKIAGTRTMTELDKLRIIDYFDLSIEDANKMLYDNRLPVERWSTRVSDSSKVIHELQT